MAAPDIFCSCLSFSTEISLIFLGLLDLGYECGEGALCGTLVPDEAVVTMLHVSGRVTADVDAAARKRRALSLAADSPPLSSSEIVGWNVGWETTTRVSRIRNASLELRFLWWAARGSNPAPWD